MATNYNHALTEDDVRGQVIDYLLFRGWMVIPNIAGRLEVGDAKKTYPGIADLVILRKGRTVWLELKRPKSKGKRAGVQSDNQKQFEADILRNGGEYLLIDSLDELIKLGF